MKRDTRTFRSSIKSDLKTKKLFRGTLIAAAGMIILLYAAIYMDAAALSHWGILLYFISLGLIAFGLIPFRRLVFLENNPNLLIIIDDNSWIFFDKGKKTFTIPLEAVANISYYDIGSYYGIALSLKESPREKIVVHDRSFNFERFKKLSRRYYYCDLFLPYFSQKTYKELVNQNLSIDLE